MSVSVVNSCNNYLEKSNRKNSVGLFPATEIGMGVGAFAFSYLTGILSTAAQTVQSAILSVDTFKNAIDSARMNAGSILTNTSVVRYIIDATHVVADAVNSFDLSSINPSISGALPSVKTLGCGLAVVITAVSMVRLYDAYSAKPKLNRRRI
jgi:hypothetical protein